MATKRYLQDAEEFKADLRNAGFVVGQSMQLVQPIAAALDIQPSSVKNMLSGWTCYSEAKRKKLKGWSAAKGNGPAPEMVEQVEVDLQPERPRKSELRYQIWAGVHKIRIIEVIAVVNDPDQARRLCDLLNKEAG